MEDQSFWAVIWDLLSLVEIVLVFIVHGLSRQGKASLILKFIERNPERNIGGEANCLSLV